MIPRTMIPDQTLEVARPESDEKISRLAKVSPTLRYSCCQPLFDA